MYKQFGPEEMKEAAEGQSLDTFLNARGYAVIQRTDLGKTFMNIINGVPEDKGEEEMANFLKKHPLDCILIMAVLAKIENRIFKNCPEEE